MEDNLGDVRTLLDQGADTEIRNSRGQTALLLALSENRDVRITRLWVVRVFAMCCLNVDSDEKLGLPSYLHRVVEEKEGGERSRAQ